MNLATHFRNTDHLALILLLIICNGSALSGRDKFVLIRRLLRGYERLPPTDDGPVTVALGIYINYFYYFSEQTMDYSVSMYLRQTWNDSRLKFDPVENNNNSRLKVGQADIKRLWIPDVYIRNEKSASFHYVTSENNLLYIFDSGNLWYVSKITATLSCPMRLHRYPMDRQRCPMLFESFGYSSDEVLFKWFEPRHKAVEFDLTGQSMPQFVLDDFDLRECNYTGAKLEQFSSYPCLEVTFIVSRNLGYYMIQYYIPSILLVILSWVGFWISVDAVVARVSIGLLTVLNLTMQSTGSRNQLPQVSYIKAIDVWMSVSLGFAFASLLEFAVVNVWSRKEVKRRSGHHASAAPPAASSGPPAALSPTQSNPRATKSEQVHEFQLEQVDPTPRGRRLSQVLTRRFSKQFIQRHVRRAQNIDSLSRKLFPLSFVCFNLIYWLFYIFHDHD